MTNLKIVTLHEGNFRDPVTELRKIADEIESGEYGEISCAAVVLLGDQMEVFRAGEDSEAPSVALLLHAAFMRMSLAIEQHGRETL